MSSDVPQTTTTVRDGQMDLIGPAGDFPVVFGCSSAGTVATANLYTDANAALDALGYGPLTEVGMLAIRAAGGAILVKLTGSVAGTNSAVTAIRIGTSVGTITVSGAAFRDYRVRVLITQTTAALGSGAFKYSLDNGNTYSEELTIPSGGVYAIPKSGLTITFALQAGTPDFEAGDVHTFTATCGHWNPTNLAAGMAALLVSPLLIGRKIRKVGFAGIPADAATAATNAAAVATYMAQLQGLDHFARCMLDGGSNDSASNHLANFVAAFYDSRCMDCYGLEESITPAPIPGFGLAYVSVLCRTFERAVLQTTEISESLARVRSGVITGVKSTTLGFNEELQQAFTEDNKVTTHRTNRNKGGGVYVNKDFLKSPVGSDFKYWPWGIVLDEGCTAIVAALADWTMSNLRASSEEVAGGLDKRDAARVKKSVDTRLGAVMAGPTKDGLPSHVSEQDFTVATAYDFVGTQRLKCTYRVVPEIPIGGTDLTVGLVRSLQEVA